MKYWREPLDQVKLPSYRVIIVEDWCKGCHFCIEFCPRKVLSESTEFNVKGYHPVCTNSDDNCAGCGLCDMICPEFAIHTIPAEQEESHEKKKLSNR